MSITQKENKDQKEDSRNQNTKKHTSQEMSKGSTIERESSVSPKNQHDQKIVITENLIKEKRDLLEKERLEKEK